MTLSRSELARNAAFQAGMLLLEHFQHGDRRGSLKADRTLVTAADQAADRFIQGMITEAFPEDGILSEESSTYFPDQEQVWVIDPLDGTVNFSQGLLYWGVSIAHLENGIPQSAALYFPVVDELYSARKGAGAFLNGSPLQVSESGQESPFPLFVHCSRMHQRYQVDLPYKRRSLGAASYHLCLIARDSAALAFESTPRIWDIAGAWLVVSEAGGAITSLAETQPFPGHPGEDYLRKPFPTLAAASAGILSTARDKIVLR